MSSVLYFPVDWWMKSMVVTWCQIDHTVVQAIARFDSKRFVIVFIGYLLEKYKLIVVFILVRFFCCKKKEQIWLRLTRNITTFCRFIPWSTNYQQRTGTWWCNMISTNSFSFVHSFINTQFQLIKTTKIKFIHKKEKENPFLLRFSESDLQEFKLICVK